jgi:phosphate-selective porin OprO/OprP
MRGSRSLAIGAILALSAGSQAAAQAPLPLAESSPPRFDRAVQASPAPQSSALFRWDEHPTLQIGVVEIAFRARVQARSRTSDAPFGDEDNLAADIARRRIGVEGTIGSYADFQIEREIGEPDDPWRDVYVNYSQFEPIQLQVGKFKLPFGLEENIGSTNLDFAYRSLIANTLAPGRDRGYMVHGRVFDRILRYEFGKFDHDGRNAKPKNVERVFGEQTTVFRISAVPFRTLSSPADDFELGAAWADTEVPEGFSGIRGQTVFGEPFFSSDFYVLGPRRRFGFETRWRPGPFSIQSEFIRLTEERVGQSVEDSDLPPLRAHGWYVSGTWALTGDRKADGLDATEHPIFQGGVGAVELAVRVERLTFDSATSTSTSEPSTSPRADVILGNSNRAVTIGANWYLNRWIKVQFNLIRETLTDPEQGPLPDRSSFWSRAVKLQFTL